MQKELIEECYKKSVQLLIDNSSKYGVLASSPQKNAVTRNYLSIFARDASICSLGMVASKNKHLIFIAKKSLRTLAKYQAHNGEIPNYTKPEKSYVDFWRLGSIDATLWWLIAINFYNKYSGDKKLKKSLRTRITKALNWLSCQEHNNDGLLRQTEASDWADLMPRSGKVLYSNALWYKVKKEYNLFEKEKTAKNFNLLFYPFNNNKQKLPKSDKTTIESILKKKNIGGFYISFANYLYWGEDIDVFANSLTILSDLSTRTIARKVTKFIDKQKRINTFPVPVTFRPIKENSKLWRKYMESHKQNYPYQYHNGGTWPFAACFFSMALAKSKRTKAAKEELEKIATLNKANNWQFSEWFHTKTGQGHGMHGQSWNAGAFLLAYHQINNDIDF